MKYEIGGAMDEERKSVDAVMRNIIAEIEPIKTLGSGKALLAGIRDSIGKELTNAPQVWPLLFENLPEEYLGDKASITAEENAIYLSLQIYALMQQGASKSERGEVKSTRNIGESLRILRGDESKAKAMDERFNTMITAGSFEELAHYLRQMVKILKANIDSPFVDYPKLAKDLFWVQKGKQDNILMDWARDYYQTFQKSTVEKENTNE